MKHSLLKITLAMLYMSSVQVLFGQTDAYTVRVNADGYKHIFEGAGASYGKWLENHNKMSAADQDKVMQWAGRDLNMQYLQDYVGSYPSDNPDYFDDRADYFKAMRAYQEDIKMSVVFNNLPGRLCTTVTTRDGTQAKALDHTRTGIYDEVADWYFQVLEGFYLRDVPVSILNIVNEPDHNKDGVKYYLYGHGRDPQKGIAYLLMEAIPRLKAMINNPAINTNGIPMPKIMAFSALSARRTPEWVDHFRNNYPAAWQQVDILSTHQYARGSVNAHFDRMRNQLDGRGFIQSEMHAGRGDDLEYLEDIIGTGHYTAISAANLVICGVNGGLNSWWYFFVSASGPVDKKSALISMPWNNGAPNRSHQYYSFRQVTSLQPAFSHVMETQIDGNRNDDEVIVYRKEGDNHAYVTIVNYKDFSVPAEVIIQDGQGTILPIKSIERYVTDALQRADIADTRNYADSRNRYTFSMTPYSVNTIKVEFEQGVADCAGTIGGTAGPGSACDDGNPCTINDVYDNDCNCQGKPAYPQVEVVAENENCDALGAIRFSFDAVDYRTNIEFSYDGGNTYPLNVRDDVATAVFDDLEAGTYPVYTRWGNNECPVDLGEVEILADPKPNVEVLTADPQSDQQSGMISFYFEDTPRWRIEFSMNNGATYPLNVVDNVGNTAFENVAPGDYSIWTRWGNDDCPVDLGTVTINPSTITGMTQLSGPDCSNPQEEATFELVNIDKTTVTSTSWWFSGAASSIAEAQSMYSATFDFNQYFDGGEACVGVNLNVPPYYKSYCKPVVVCGPHAANTPVYASIYPNPSESEFITISVNPDAGTIINVSVMDKVGNVKFTSTTLVSGNVIDVSDLSPATYYLTIVTEKGTVTEKLTIL